MPVRRQPPPAIFSLLHKGKFGPGRVGELVQEFNPQSGADQGIDHIAKTVIPDVIFAARSLALRGIGTASFNALRFI